MFVPQETQKEQRAERSPEDVENAPHHTEKKEAQGKNKSTRQYNSFKDYEKEERLKEYDLDVEATEEYGGMGINLRVIVPRKRAK